MKVPPGLIVTSSGKIKGGAPGGVFTVIVFIHEPTTLPLSALTACFAKKTQTTTAVNAAIANNVILARFMIFSFLSFYRGTAGLPRGVVSGRPQIAVIVPVRADVYSDYFIDGVPFRDGL